MKKYISLTIVCCFLSVWVQAQNSARIYKSAKKESGTLFVYTNDGHYEMTPYSNQIIETTFLPKGEAKPKASHAVVLKPNAKFKVKESKTEVRLLTKGLEVQITKTPFQIRYLYNKEQVIAENLGYSKNDTYELLNFELTTDEILYGAGARVLGMNRRGNRLQLYNRAHYGYETHSELMNFTMPIVVSSKKYMVHFDNAAIGYLDLDSQKNNNLTYETISGRKTYHIIVGDTWEELIDNYTDLTGKQPMPPRWVFGNFSSRFGYHSQTETMATIDAFKKEEIPVDAIILDLYWFGKDMKGNMGNFEFLKDSFPNPKKMIADLKKKGVKTVLITEPFVLTASKNWQNAVDNKVLGTTTEGEPFTYDFYFGNTGLIDVFKPEGKKWFWNVYKKFADYGVKGWWGDLGEPEVHPSELQHSIGSADEVHNIYGHQWAKLISDGYKEYFPNERPFILMRAGYAGSQRYGLIPWSGDVNRTWGGLKPQTEISLQMGLQGIGYMHSDLGGFAGKKKDAELYTRWLQYGVFQPIYRPHAQEDVPSEPVFWDTKTKALAKQSIELRYQLLPYNYTLAFENSRTGLALMRPLFFDNNASKEAFEISNTYFWGHEFLVSPIVSPGVKTKEISFPKGNNWFDFYTDKQFDGGSTATVEIKENSIPTYVRGGAFVPMIETIQTTDVYSLDTLRLHFYFDKTVKSSKGQLYNDDGVTSNAFTKGQYELLKFTARVTTKSVTINIATEIGKEFNASDKEISLIVHNIQKAPKSVKGFEYTYDNANKKITITIPYNNTPKKVRVKL